MSDQPGLSIPDFSLAAEPAGEHLRNSLVMLGALRRIVERTAGERPDALALVEAISARLEKALAQVEDRHEFGCTAYVGRPCICATLRKQRAFGSRPAAAPAVKLTDEDVARITDAIYQIEPHASLFDNVPSDMTWGELVRAIADLLPLRGAATPTEPQPQ